MRTRFVRATGLALAALSMPALACSTTYTPRPSREIRTVVGGASGTYLRGDDRIDVGSFYGGLEAAVAAVPEAEAEAQDASTDSKWGTGVGALGALLFGASLGVFNPTLGASDPYHPPPLSTTRILTGSSLLTAGLSILWVGVDLMTFAAGHANDAINLYDDRVFAP
jgi:hypothetical protein